MLKSSQQCSIQFAPTPSYHTFTPENTLESNVTTGPHHSGVILTLSATERAIAAPLPSMYFQFFFLIEMSLVQKQCNIINQLATDRIAALNKHRVMSPNGYDMVNA